MKTKHLIVGAGIAGLYSAYKIHKKYNTNQILIIEQDTRIGGKIFTLPIDLDTNIELGAGVIHSNNICVMKLLQDLNLHKKLSCVPVKKTYWKLTNNHLTQTNTIDKFNKYIKYLSEYKKKHDVKKYSLAELVKKILPTQISIDMINAHGYTGDFTLQNASDGIDMLISDYNNKTCFLNGGLSQMTNGLVSYLKSVGVNILTSVRLLDIQSVFESKYNSVVSYGKKYFNIDSQSVILAIPAQALKTINFMNPINGILDTLNYKSLFRIYFIFPSELNKSWFDFITGSISTNTVLGQIIPINKNKGILMIYVSDAKAKFLFKLYLKNKSEFNHFVCSYMSKLFNVKVPSPTNTYFKYWNGATHIWKPNVDSSVLSDKIIHPFPNEQVYVVGESYAKNFQQWMEGALSTVDYMMDKFDI